MKYFSMFSGIGGFELGIQNALAIRDQDERHVIGEVDQPDNSSELPQEGRLSASCVGYSEIDKYAIKVYERQFNGHTNYGDATNINAKELPDFDLLVGGFPCQAFSIAGKRKGFDDTRGTLFFDIARILAEKRPRHLVLENVKGLLSHDSGKTFQTILGVLSDLGYRVEWQVLNSKDFGVPQNRERIYFVGHLRGECSGEVLPIRQDGKVSSKRQGQISPTITQRYYKQGQSDPYIFNDSTPSIRKLTPKECERLQGFPETEVDAIIKVCIDHQKNSVDVELKSLKSQELAGTVARTELVNDASSAKSNSPLNDQPISKHAQPNVHIRLEGERVVIRNQKKSLLYASGATSLNSSVLPMPNDVFAQTIAGILRTAERITQAGKVESVQNERSLTDRESGKNSGKIFGCEITLPAKDVLSDLTTLKESLKSTTSDHLDLEKLGSNLATLSYYAASATSGYMDDSTKTKSILTFHLSECYGWTQYAADGTPISDTQRYKMCGNAVTTNVVQAVFERMCI